MTSIIERVGWVLRSLKNELGYELPRLEVFSDMSGRVRGDFDHSKPIGDELFRFDNLDDIVSAYMDWRAKTGGASHVRKDGGC